MEGSPDYKSQPDIENDRINQADKLINTEEKLKEPESFWLKNFEKLKEKAKEILKKSSAKARTFVLYGMICLATASPEATLAKAKFNIDNEKNIWELFIDDEDEKNKEVKEGYCLKLVPLNEIGIDTTSHKFQSPVFEKIDTTAVEMSGVNYEIKDRQSFNDFVSEQAILKSEELGFELDKITPQELILLTAKITEDNLEYEYGANWLDAVVYSDSIDQEISEMPLDQMLIKNKKGVCRHYAVLYKLIFDEIKEISKSSYLENILVKEVPNFNIMHAYNVVFELHQDDKSTTIKMSFLDTTFDDNLGNFNDNLEAGDEDHGGKRENFLGTTFGTVELFNFNEQIDVLDAFKEFYVDSTDVYNEMVISKYDLIMYYADQEMAQAVLFSEKKDPEGIEKSLEILQRAWDEFKNDVVARDKYNPNFISLEDRLFVDRKLGDYVKLYWRDIPIEILDPMIKESIDMGIIMPARFLLTNLQEEALVLSSKKARKENQKRIDDLEGYLIGTEFKFAMGLDKSKK
ncbi:MAG: hypothetical protein PHS07_00480 [Patescibacteria group bacterium]|nr:hypothetical protein [Patescibacteria group bacterium]